MEVAHGLQNHRDGFRQGLGPGNNCRRNQRVIGAVQKSQQGDHLPALDDGNGQILGDVEHADGIMVREGFRRGVLGKEGLAGGYDLAAEGRVQAHPHLAWHRAVKSTTDLTAKVLHQGDKRAEEMIEAGGFRAQPLKELVEVAGRGEEMGNASQLPQFRLAERSGGRPRLKLQHSRWLQRRSLGTKVYRGKPQCPSNLILSQAFLGGAPQLQMRQNRSHRLMMRLRDKI